MTSDIEAPLVRDNDREHRYEIAVDGHVAGFAAYLDRAGRRVFVHTEIDPSYEGQGLGGRLVRAALDDARSRGLPVVPLCPFVRRFLARHPDYVDLVPEAERARLGLSRRNA